MDINVMDYVREAKSNVGVCEIKRSYEVGDVICIPYKIVEINTKMTGDLVLKQFRLEGPAVDPSKETYTEQRLRDVFGAI